MKWCGPSKGDTRRRKVFAWAPMKMTYPMNVTVWWEHYFVHEEFKHNWGDFRGKWHVTCRWTVEENERMCEGEH
jgi:hypothetical protein